MKKKQTIRKKRKQPELKFGRGDFAGFTSIGTTSFGIKSSVVVRELIQNSLDAAREAKRKVARIRFELQCKATRDVPSIDIYKQALKKAIIDQECRSKGKLPDHAKLVADSMSQSIKKEKNWTLYVLDNGIGLNEEKMSALLADGLSSKEEGQTGAFGNGHMAVIPASDLRYILYGGLRKKGKNYTYIASGHTILASRAGKNKETLSKDGFFLHDYRDKFDAAYDFPTNASVPKYIKEKLEWIKKNWDSAGSVVIIPGFNHFHDKNAATPEAIKRAAACNFFIPIATGDLIIQYSGEDRKDDITLDKNELKKVLQSLKDETRRGSQNSFISGANAFRSYETYTSGKKKTIPTTLGKIKIRLRELNDGSRSRLDLFRNGMWITDDIPDLRYNNSRLTKLKAFHCLLLIDSDDGDIHQYVRTMEGALHNELDKRKLETEKRKKNFREAMDKVQETIAQIIHPNTNENFWIKDALTVQVNKISEAVRNPVRNANFVEKPPRIQPLDINKEEINIEAESSKDWDINTVNNQNNDANLMASEKTNNANRNFQRSGSSLAFQALPISIGKRSIRIYLTPQEKCVESELRFMIDNGLDESCDVFDAEIFVQLKNTKLNGQLLSENRLIRDEDGYTLAVRLGQLNPEEKICVESDYVIPANINISNNIPVVLKAQVVRRLQKINNNEN